MPTCQACTPITAPADEVWRTLSNVHDWPAWLPTVLKVEPLDGEHLAIGARFVVHQPRLRPATWVVSELTVPGSFVWVARSAGLVMTATHTVVRQTPSTAVATLSFSFGGLLGGLVGRVYRGLTQSYLSQEAASLKRRVEAQVP